MGNRGSRQVVGALDQGTQSTRFIAYDAKTLEKVAVEQLALTQHTPKPGWTEHCPKEIMETALGCMRKLARRRNLQFVAIGITNQRETTVVWDRTTGEPLYNAIVWLDTRTSTLVHEMEAEFGGTDAFRNTCGLPFSTYFSALKMKWLLENVPAVAKAASEKRLCLGTVDSWLLYNLSGGASHGGVFVTDVTNASRYFLMDLNTQQWSPAMCKALGVPLDALPTIVSSAEQYATVAERLPLAGVMISGCLGDQHAALLGQCCREGEAKCTYGTGSFLLVNTGAKICQSTHGLLTTVAFQLGRDSPTQYALEGAVPCAGMAVSWLKDNLEMLDAVSKSEEIASSVDDSGGCIFVPALSGLFAPRWRTDARGCIVGMSLFTTKAHIVRALLEGVAHQIREVVDAMGRDAKKKLKKMRVDGGMTSNALMMQIQADMLGTLVERPSDIETTARGAAVAAKIGAGLMTVQEAFDVASTDIRTWIPQINDDARQKASSDWEKAVERSLGWVV